MRATALVLAGGKSSRMGRPKAWLDFGGEPLLRRIVGIVSTVCDEVFVVSGVGQELPATPARVIEDQIPGQGPLSGLHAGLSAATWDVCFMTSCDVPFLKPAFVRHVLEFLESFDIAVPRWKEEFQPMQAAYRRGILPVVGEHLEKRKLRPLFLFERLKTRILEESDLRGVDPQGESFMNINTPEEYAASLAVLRRQGPAGL